MVIGILERQHEKPVLIIESKNRPKKKEKNRNLGMISWQKGKGGEFNPCVCPRGWSMALGLRFATPGAAAENVISRTPWPGVCKLYNQKRSKYWGQCLNPGWALEPECVRTPQLEVFGPQRHLNCVCKHHNQCNYLSLRWEGIFISYQRNLQLEQLLKWIQGSQGS